MGSRLDGVYLMAGRGWLGIGWSGFFLGNIQPGRSQKRGHSKNAPARRPLAVERPAPRQKGVARMTKVSVRVDRIFTVQRR